MCAVATLVPAADDAADRGLPLKVDGSSNQTIRTGGRITGGKRKRRDSRATPRAADAAAGTRPCGVGPGENRLIPYETADERFKELWEEFGQPGTPPRVYYPFGRLRNDERQTSASAKPSALGSRADSDRTSTICYATNRNSYPALLTRSCPNTSRHRSIGTSWRPCESRRGHPPSVLTNPCLKRGRKVREYTPRDPRFRREGP